MPLAQRTQSAKLDEAKKLIDEGGDWDRRNRLKLYRALHCMFVRDFKTAASLLLDCVATFTVCLSTVFSFFFLFRSLYLTFFVLSCCWQLRMPVCSFSCLLHNHPEHYHSRLCAPIM